jgi:hypothetical protein
LVISVSPKELRKGNGMYALINQMANDRNAELRRDASARRLGRLARRRRAAIQAADGSTEEVTVRRLDPLADHAALVRLAERDSADVPRGELVGAEVHGSLVAAISLGNRRVIADPFEPTANVRSLLEVRAAQLA